jgi:hypothetical protein
MRKKVTGNEEKSDGNEEKSDGNELITLDITGFPDSDIYYICYI